MCSEAPVGQMLPIRRSRLTELRKGIGLALPELLETRAKHSPLGRASKKRRKESPRAAEADPIHNPVLRGFCAEPDWSMAEKSVGATGFEPAT